MLLAVATIGGFILRGLWMIVESPLLDARAARTLPHVVDTLFLATGVAMLFDLSMNPLNQPWLLAKFAGLIAYIVLGTIALRRGRSKRARVTAFAAAVVVFAWISGVARSKSLASWLALVGT
jgi:uncharacterized membrane protein SirB2